jgi:hypothetical protein
MIVRSPKLVSSEDQTGARVLSASYCSTEGVVPLHTAPPVPVTAPPVPVTAPPVPVPFKFSRLYFKNILERTLFQNSQWSLCTYTVSTDIQNQNVPFFNLHLFPPKMGKNILVREYINSDNFSFIGKS